jgi:fructokinase
VTTDCNGNATFVIERPMAFDCVDLSDSLLSKTSQMRPEWIYFGTLAQSMGQGEERLERLLAANPQARCFYDVNLREGHWNLKLVQRLSKLASIIKLNAAEAETLFELTNGTKLFSIDVFCRFWSSTYGGQIICITLGDKGCSVWRQDCLQSFPGHSVSVVDTVGAGDAFAAAFLHGYESSWSIERTARFANAVGALVVSRAGAMPNWNIGEILPLIESNQL